MTTNDWSLGSIVSRPNCRTWMVLRAGLETG